MKNQTEISVGKLIANEVLEKLQTHLVVDFITKLLLVAEKDTILVVCNRLSKMVHFVAITEGLSAEGLAWLFRDKMWKLHRLPKGMILDRGLQFVVELTKKLNRMLGIQTKLLTLFHSQTDGQTEQINQELEQYLLFFVDYRQKDWPQWLVIAEFAVNNKTHSVTKMSLFIANYRRELRMRADIRKKGKVEKVMEFVERMKKVQEEAGAALRKAQKEMK